MGPAEGVISKKKIADKDPMEARLSHLEDMMSQLLDKDDNPLVATTDNVSVIVIHSLNYVGLLPYYLNLAAKSLMMKL